MNDHAPAPAMTSQARFHDLHEVASGREAHKARLGGLGLDGQLLAHAAARHLEREGTHTDNVAQMAKVVDGQHFKA